MRFTILLGLGFLGLFVASPAIAAVPWIQIKLFGLGQGDTVLIQTPSGKAALLDTGEDSGQADLLLSLRQEKLQQVDALFFSHLDNSVFGGLATLLRGWSVKEVLGPGFPTKSAAWKKAQAHLRKKSLSVRAVERGQTIDLEDGVRFKILWPKTPFLKRSSPLHANSLVMQLEYQNLRVLFLGAASPDAEKALLREGDDLKSQVVKIAHPTQGQGVSKALLEAVQPRLILLGCTKHHRRACPHPSLQSRFSGIKVVSPKNEGPLQLLSDGQHLWLGARPQGSPDILQVLPLTPEADKPEPTPPASPEAGRPTEPIKPDLERSRSPGRSFSLPEKPGWLDLKAQGKTKLLPPPFPSKDGYVASRQSRFFHRASCRFAKLIPPNEKITLQSRKDALRRHRPAGDCLP